MKECVFEANLEGQGWYYTFYHFGDSNKLIVEISSKKRRQQKNGALNQKIEKALYTCIEASVFYCFLII